MSNFKVIGSEDYANASGNQYVSFGGGAFHIAKRSSWGKTEKFSQSETKLIPVSEENVKQFGGAAGFGVAGAVLFGPAGLLAGVLLGGNKKTHALIAVFPDGTKAMIEMNAQLYKKLLANEMSKSDSLLLAAE